jgi:hypothetical protein
MWYGDPNARRAARYARRNARRAYRYRYGRPGGSIVGLIFFVFIMLAIFTHFWAWFIPGIIIVALALWLLRSGMFGMWLNRPQQPSNQAPPQGPQAYYQPPPPEQQSYYQPTPAEQQPYQPYAEGYQAPQAANQEGEARARYPQPKTDPEYQEYEEPQAQYPEQMPPMQQQ